MTIGLAWLVLVMGFPRAYTDIKIYGLIFISFIALTEIMVKKIKINIKYMISILFFIVICVSSLLLGVISGYKFNSDDIPLIQYYIITPICSLLLAMIFYNKDRREVLKKSLICIAFGISLYNLLYLLSYNNIIPNFSILQFGFLASNEVYENQLAVRMSNEPALIFLMPFLIISLYDLKSYEKKYRILIYFGIIFGCVYAALSGRRALEVVIILSVIYLAGLLFKKGNLKKYIKFILEVLILIIVSYYTLSKMSNILGLENIFQSITKTFFKGFSSNEYGMIKRQGNTSALLSGWMESPFTVLFGHGLNSYAQNSIANLTTLWSYEVFYPAFLYQTGVIGMFTLFSIIVGILKTLNIKIKKQLYSNDYRAIKVAFICILIASGTNPLLYNVWIWAIVLSFII